MVPPNECQYAFVLKVATMRACSISSQLNDRSQRACARLAAGKPALQPRPHQARVRAVGYRRKPQLQQRCWYHEKCLGATKGEMMVKLVLTDMDNTLLAFQHPVSDRALAAIHSLLDQGVRFGPASGRDYDSVLESFRGDEACIQTALFSNGKRIFVDGSLINQTAVDRDSMVTMAKMVYDLPGVYISGRGEGGGFVSGSTLESLLGTEWGGRRASELVDPEDIPTWAIVTAGLHFEDGSEDIDNEAWADKIREACPKLDLLSPGSRMFDVVPHGWSKASGVRVLQILLAIDASEIVAFGDSDNDLEMLKAVGHPVAVANANDAVKSVARHFIGSVEEDAVGAALTDLAELGDAAYDKWDAEAEAKGWM